MKTIFAWLISLMFLGSGLVYAGEGPYINSAHGGGGPGSGVDRSAATGVEHPDATKEYAAGHCGHCHEMHASIGGGEPAPTGDTQNPYALFKENYGSVDRNQLCYACHENLPSLGGMPLKWGRYGIYEGKTRYTASDHNTNTNMVWPGASPPGPGYTDYGNCHNCHNPQGYEDGSGLIPSQLFKREEDLCEACHTDIESAANKTTSKHPIHLYAGRHNLPEGGSSSFGSANRHAECVDCHNPHNIGAIALVPLQSILLAPPPLTAPQIAI